MKVVKDDMENLTHEEMVKDIHQALVGDKYRKGLIHDVERLKNESRVHKVFISVGTFLSIVLGYFFSHNN